MIIDTYILLLDGCDCQLNNLYNNTSFLNDHYQPFKYRPLR